MSNRAERPEDRPGWARIHAPNAVRAGSTTARLAAIAKRQGAGLGHECIGPRKVDGQTDIFDELGAPDTEDTGRKARKAQGDLT